MPTALSAIRRFWWIGRAYSDSWHCPRSWPRVSQAGSCLDLLRTRRQNYEKGSGGSGRNWRWLTPAVWYEFIQSRNERFEPGIRKHHLRQVVALTGFQYP